MSRASKITLYAGLIITGLVLAYCSSQEFTAVELSAAHASKSRMFGYAAGAFLMLIAVGLLAAYDISQFIGNRVEEFVFNDDLEGNYDPEYEHAEQVWADGDHLEAIRLMREYFKKHPSEVHVPLRIAEIYEQNLGNALAAALEYEEVLKLKLPRERWGWAAIHLCNLYSKLKKTDQAVALLKRIDAEYSETAAAKKARERLAQIEPEKYSQPKPIKVEVPQSGESPSEEAPAPAEPPAQKLPPGFRPKK